MRFNRVLCLLNVNKFNNMQLYFFRKYNFGTFNFNNVQKLNVTTKWHLPNTNCVKYNSQRNLHEDVVTSDDELETDSHLNLLEDAYLDTKIYSRNLLYKNTRNPVLILLKNCASVEEVLNVFNNNKVSFDHRHITQTILVLSDIFEQFKNVTDERSEEFINQLHKSLEFQNILVLIENNLNKFDTDTLSYVLYYLNNLGVKTDSQLLHLILQRIKDGLEKKFNLATTSRFLKIVCSENSLRSFFTVQSLMPMIYDKIDTHNLEEFENVTVCLNKLNRIVSDEILKKYKRKLNYFIDNDEITSKNYKIILKVLLLLNYPQWREVNSPEIVKCISLLRENLHLLNSLELSVLFEIFFKQQEPGYILSELQRCCVKRLVQNEEEMNLPIVVQLKLFSAVIYFSSPQYRNQCKDEVYKFIEKCDSYEALIPLRKILSYVKTSDKKLCETYWKKIVTQLLREELSENSILKLCQNYMNFNIDIDNFRYEEFERRILYILSNMLKNSALCLMPVNLCNILSFILLYGNNVSQIDFIITKLEENVEQLDYADCLFISKNLKLLNNNRNKRFKLFEIHRVKKLLDNITEREIASSDISSKKLNMLLKSCVLRNASDNMILSCLQQYKNRDFISSKSMESILFCCISRNLLIPEIMDKIVEFAINNKDKLLGYNMEKILYACFNLGYVPKNIDVFLKASSDILIRDQDRLTGLSILQSALALSFFNTLPHSFIKKIFNVEFLENLDLELENCYSKESYPQRVRNNLMQLNRAVCLNYPESNVPWFHQKYMDVAKNKVLQNLEHQKLFPMRVKTYLSQILKKPQYIDENVITPYGYYIDFVINFNDSDEIVEPTSNEIRRKTAVILLQNNAFTKVVFQLRGKYQLMKRHIEMLGYEVVIIHFQEWINLVYADERIDFLSNLIRPNKVQLSSKITNR